jgi:hypothetical protein
LVLEKELLLGKFSFLYQLTAVENLISVAKYKKCAPTVRAKKEAFLDLGVL